MADLGKRWHPEQGTFEQATFEQGTRVVSHTCKISLDSETINWGYYEVIA